VASGITRRFLPAATEVIVTLNDPQVPTLAAELATTRSAAAVELWRGHMDGAVVVVGNAPTTLFRCLEIIADGGPRPAAIIGCPVGFVGAAESKAALARATNDVPFLAVHGTRGGSAMASSVVNALAIAGGRDGRP